MRILFTGPGAAGHLFPMVTTAQALRAAGHEVLFAGSAPIDLLRNTGLPMVEIGDGSTLKDSFLQFQAEFTDQNRSHEDTIRLAARGFAQHGRVSIDGLLAVATAWRPDVLVHAPFQSAAPLVAAKLDIPAVVHNFGVLSGTDMVARLAGLLSEEYAAHGVAGPATHTVIDVVPESFGGDGGGWRVRYVPFNGGGAVPAELLGRGERPRIAVTLGTVVTDWSGVNSLVRLVAEAAEVDADFLLAVGGADLSSLGTLPGNVRALPWVPLAQLVESSDAIVHHGGAGTLLTAAAYGIPQLVLPQGADHFVNVDAAERAGFALRGADAEVDAAQLTRLVQEDSLRKGAHSFRTEIEGLPSPATLVASFEALL
ncbi:glycosyltransferase [Kitasatospora sp. NPDC002227]|uniref:glycosyltransferase n=1 Tax=Kitasatospora sp. NPDC002227 TaxID=3154773 RepID=UPI00332FD42E